MKRSLLVAAMAVLADHSKHAVRAYEVRAEPAPIENPAKRDKSEARRARREQIRRNGGKR